MNFPSHLRSGQSSSFVATSGPQNDVHQHVSRQSVLVLKLLLVKLLSLLPRLLLLLLVLMLVFELSLEDRALCHSPELRQVCHVDRLLGEKIQLVKRHRTLRPTGTITIDLISTLQDNSLKS